MPPPLNIPGRVTDLSAFERGSKIIVQFSAPQFTTEGKVLKNVDRVELRAGAGGAGPFNADAWVASAKSFEIPFQPGRTSYEIPAAEWVGKDVVFAVRVFGRNGRDSGWSNFAQVSVVPALDRPTGLRAEPVASGVRLVWNGSGSAFRIFRRAGKEEAATAIATSERPEWTDTSTEYGTPYQYFVQAFTKAGAAEAESELSDPVEITPQDRFPPAVPSGLAAVASTRSIELVWERNTERDLAGYRVYRAGPGGNFERIANTQESPSYSDHKIESGKPYRYAVSSVDKLGNESKMSAPVEITAP